MRRTSQQLVLVRGVDAVDQHAALRRQEYAVEELGQRALAGAVVAEDGDEAALLYLEVDAVQRLLLVPLIGEMQVFCLYDGHGYLPLSQRQAAPAGRQSPDAVTGRPSSSLSLRPPKRRVKMLSLI